MNDTDSRYFRRFLRDVEKRSASFVTVFRVPFVDKDVLECLRLSSDDVLCVRSVSFPPPTGSFVCAPDANSPKMTAEFCNESIPRV